MDIGEIERVWEVEPVEEPVWEEPIEEPVEEEPVPEKQVLAEAESA
ncbi:MAG: hypothetical protein ACE5MI_09260 [Acidimicrobiia bacterium]